MKQRFSTRTRLVSALLTLAMVFTFLPVSAFADDDVDYWVPLHSENFPDETFLEYIRTTFDKGGGGWDDGEPNGILEPDEHKTVYTIDVSGMNITSLSGISVFHNLKKLYCSNNQLTSLNLSRNTKLTQENLKCTGNKYPITIDVTERTFDLSTLPPDFDVNKTSGWAGGTVEGNTLKVKPGATQVTYTYDCGNGLTAEFALTVNEDTTVGGNISLNKLRFPDDTFRDYLRRFDTNNTNLLSRDEWEAVTEIDVSDGYYGQKITSLKGIEFFPNLKTLLCYNNQLTELDVSQNKKLERLYCFKNQLTELDVSQNTALIELRCEHNPLTKLDVSKNTALKMLACEKNQLTSLDVSWNTALEKLYCSQNQLTKLDVSKNLALWHLSCYENQLTELDVSQNPALKNLYCHENQLTELDVSQNQALEELYCHTNQLTSLDVSKNTALKELYCYSNQLTSLNLSRNTKLTQENLKCTGNKYPITIDVTERTFDLSTLPPDFDVNKTSGWAGGTVEGNTLKVKPGATQVTYTYDCGNGLTAEFALTVKEATTGCTYIPLNAYNFPDPAFRECLKKPRFDNDQDEWLSSPELNDIRDIRVPQKGIASLKGIEKFPNLTTLICSENQLTELDVSQNKKLVYLECSKNQLTSLDLSDTELTPARFKCSGNKYPITIDATKRTFDLNDLPTGFDVNKTSGWVGGDVDGNTLKVDEDATEVTYTYDCGKGCNATFTLNVKVVPDGTVTPPSGGDNPGGGSTPGGDTPGGGSTGGGDGGGAVVIVAAAGAAVAGVVGYGVYNYVSGRKLQALLPEGVAAPENRAQTALLLWNTAGRPEPAEAPAFADVADPDTAKAAQWCVEQGLMKRRLSGKFAPGSSIPAYQVLNAYRKLAGG